ncbi:MAG: hypothetical protein SFH39_00965 [Candidatus Magnetobacterium sp. LHC-1]|nr:hypothetical protein [Nitrospirota bacterium]
MAIEKIKKSKRPGILQLNSEIVDSLANFLRLGADKKTACESCGIHYDTFRRWMQKGEKEKTGIYRNLYNVIKKALADNEIRLIAIIQKAAEVDWKAAAWMLERKYPDNWGRHLLFQSEVATGSNITINIRPASARKDDDRQEATG